MSEEELTECNNCHFDCKKSELESNYNGDCDDCQRWFGCINSEEKPCLYYDDCCHYLCRECRDGKNFELDITGSEEWKLNRIMELKEEIKILENEVKNNIE